MSGNGLRCLVHAAIDSGALPGPPGRQHQRAHRGRPAQGSCPGAPRRLDVGEHGDGHPRVSGPEERCNVGHGQLLVEVGNPHLVVLGPDPETVDVAALGPALSRRPGRQPVASMWSSWLSARSRRTDDAGLGTGRGRDPRLWHGLGGRRRRSAPLGARRGQGDRQPTRGGGRGRTAPGRECDPERPEPAIGRCWLDGGGRRAGWRRGAARGRVGGGRRR